MTKNQYKIIIARNGLLHRIRQVKHLGENSIFSASNINNIFLEKMRPFSGGYYIKVKNTHINKNIEIGILSINNIFKKQKAIEEYNRAEKANLPNIIENPLYYIKNNYLKLTNFRSLHYSALTMAFFKVRKAKNAKEIHDILSDPSSSHGEATFHKNEDSEVFRYASIRKYKILIAKLAAAR